MSFLTYEEVRPWARAIKERTVRREMPPWFIEKNIGVQHFKDDISLSDEEMGALHFGAYYELLMREPAERPLPRLWRPPVARKATGLSGTILCPPAMFSRH